MNEIIIIEDPKKKHIKNLYLNDFNYFHKNNIKMRRSKEDFMTKYTYEKYIDKINHPMPKLLYSSIHFTPSEERKRIEEDNQAKIKQLNTMLDFANNFDFFNCKDDDKNDINNQTAPNNDNLFLTKTQEPKKEYVGEIKESLNNDIQRVKVPQMSLIYSQKEFEEIKSNSKSLRNKDLMDDLSCNNRVSVTIDDKFFNNEALKTKSKSIEHKYLDFKKRQKYPNLFYSKLNSFQEVFNKDLGTVSHSYGTIKARTKFLDNPLLKEYFNMVPVFDMYKDIKTIENKYASSKFKFKLLPLVNTKKRQLDIFAEQLYKLNHVKKGLEDTLNSQNFKESYKQHTHKTSDPFLCYRKTPAVRNNKGLFTTYSKSLRKSMKTEPNFNPNKIMNKKKKVIITKS